MSSVAPLSVTSPLRTIRSGLVLRMRFSAETPTLASVGLAAVNWMSDSVPKDQSSLPLVVPSAENSASGLSSSCGGLATVAELSASMLLNVTTPFFWLATLVSMTCEAVIVTGKVTVVGNAKTRSLSPTLIGEPSGPLVTPLASR